MAHAQQRIMPGGGSVIDPVLKRYMDEQRRLQIFSMISRAGRALVEGNRRGRSPIRSLSAGLARGRPAGTDPMEMLRMQEVIDRTRARQDERQRARGQHVSQEALGAGNRYDPRNQILWNRPPAPGREPLPMTSEQRQHLAAQAYPEAAAKAGGARYFPMPQTPPTGFRRTPTGLEPTPGGPADIGYLGRKAGATQKPKKATMGDRKLALLNKWRAAQEGRGEWADADQAEWDMIIRADPMDILRRNLLQGMGRDPAASTSGSGAQAGSPEAEPLAFVTPLGPPFVSPQGPPLASVSPLGLGAGNGATPPAREIAGATRPIPRTAQGGVDAGRLDVGQVYEAADGTRWRWNGQNFTEVQ